MHIPDGYLSPETCGVGFAVMLPAWATAGKRVRKVVKSRYVPLLAIGAAYSFLVMMFNVPVPDGTTAHAVGAVLIAVILGPWAAIIAVSTAVSRSRRCSSVTAASSHTASTASTWLLSCRWSAISSSTSH